MSEPQPINGKRTMLGFHVERRYVDTGAHRYCSRVFGSVEIRGVHESGMGPYLARVRWKRPPFMGLYPPRTVLWSSNQSAISGRSWGFLTVQGGVDPRNLGLLPRSMEVLEMWNDLWTGDGTLYPPEVELAQHANHGQSESQSAGGVGISTPCGEVSCVDGFRSRHVTLSCSGDAYFVYESCPMSDQTKLTCLFLSNKTRV